MSCAWKTREKHVPMKEYLMIGIRSGNIEGVTTRMIFKRNIPFLTIFSFLHC